MTKKIKCFATKKGIEPIVLNQKTLQRFAPFLIASTMMFTACKQPSPPQSKKDWEKVFNQALLKGDNSESSIIDFSDAKELRDTNFNHLPENSENFWEIVKNGLMIIDDIQKADNLSYMQKKDYQEMAEKMMKKIDRTDEVDLQNPDNLRAFLYFEKVVKFRDKHHEVFVDLPGWIDEQNDFFGRDYLELEKFINIAQNNPGIAQFAEAFYSDNGRFIISEKDSARANALSMQILDDWLKKQGIYDKNLWYYDNVKDYEAKGQKNHPLNELNYWYKRGNVVGNSLGVDGSGYLGYGLCSPKGLIIIHELRHAEENPPKSGEKPYDNLKSKALDNGRLIDQSGELSELGPALETLALSGLIYKQIHHIPQNHLVNYGVNIRVGKTEIPLGEIELWANEMMQKYPDRSISRMLQQEEVYMQLNDWGNGKYKSRTLKNSKTRNS